MPLPESGSISLSQIITEATGAPPTIPTTYQRFTDSAYCLIGQAPPVSFSDLYGASYFTYPDITRLTIDAINMDEVLQNVDFTIESDIAYNDYAIKIWAEVWHEGINIGASQLIYFGQIGGQGLVYEFNNIVMDFDYLFPNPLHPTYGWTDVLTKITGQFEHSSVVEWSDVYTDRPPSSTY